MQRLPLAKDGMDLPERQQKWMPAFNQIVVVGETMDFQFTPEAPGDYHFELWRGAARSRLIKETTQVLKVED